MVVEVVVVNMKENSIGEEMEYTSCHRTRRRVQVEGHYLDCSDPYFLMKTQHGMFRDCYHDRVTTHCLLVKLQRESNPDVPIMKQIWGELAVAVGRELSHQVLKVEWSWFPMYS